MSDVKDWGVAGGIVLDGDALLLVQNRRRNGAFDWSPPGGVIEIAEGEAVVDGLTREVEEETGLRVSAWAGPIYEVRADAPGLGWRLRAEVHVALEYEGDLRVDDPDGIVVDARFVPVAECGVQPRRLPPLGARAAGGVARRALGARRRRPCLRLPPRRRHPRRGLRHPPVSDRG